MKRRWNEVCFMLPAVLAGIAAVAGFRMNMPVFTPITYPAEEIMKEAEESPAPDEETKNHAVSKEGASSGKKPKKVRYTRNSIWRDGVYTGSGTGFGGVIKVRVTIENGKIVSIQILSCAGETPSYLERAKDVISNMIAAQSPDVDVVSGATYSSNGIRTAVIQALNKAGGKLSAQPKTIPVNNRSTKEKKKLLPVSEKQPSGFVKDGVYRVSAACEPDAGKAFAAYSLTADVIFKNGKCTSIGNFSSTDESNKSYYLRAADGTANVSGVVDQILERQSASGISAVSGATCSSKTIQKLYLKALRKATGEKGEPEKEEVPVLIQTPAPSPSALPIQTPVPAPSVLPAQIPSEGDMIDSEETTLQDGTYTASAMVAADEWEEFEDYSLTADVTFSGGRLTAITNLVPEDITNQWYCNSAANGFGTKTGIIQQLIDRQDSDVDAVSGATCSSMALVEIYKNALEMATKQGQE